MEAISNKRNIKLLICWQSKLQSREPMDQWIDGLMDQLDRWIDGLMDYGWMDWLIDSLIYGSIDWWIYWSIDRSI